MARSIDLKITAKFYIWILALSLLNFFIANKWLDLTTYGWGIVQGALIMGWSMIAANTGVSNA